MRRSFSSFAFMTLLIVSMGCSKQSAEDKARADDTKLARSAAQQLVDRFQKNLKRELTAELNSPGGSAHAIEVCQSRAPEITRAATGSQAVSFRRVSDRSRNPENAASAHQIEILNRFASERALKFLDEWQVVDTLSYYRYYQPILVQLLCVKCHGDHLQIDDATAATLTSLYPGDRAIGYQVGDLRGMFVIEMAWPEAETYARTLASDTL